MWTDDLTGGPSAADDMARDGKPPLLIRKLAQFVTLDPDQRNFLSRLLSANVRVVDRHAPLIEMGKAPTEIFVVLEGWACSQRPDSSGKGQTVALHLPGDVCDFGAIIKRHMDCAIIALTKLRVASISRGAMTRLTQSQSGCAQAFWWEWMGRSSVQGQWVARLAQGSARAKIANLLCELVIRLYVVGLADDGGFDLPITQAELGASCGLTPEHTNRVFRELSANRIISWNKARVVLHDWDALCAVGSFDARYLHFRDFPASVGAISAVAEDIVDREG